MFLTRVNCLSLLAKAFHFPRCGNAVFTFKALLVRSVLIELALLSKTTSSRAISFRSPQNFLLLELLKFKRFCTSLFSLGEQLFPSPTLFLFVALASIFTGAKHRKPCSTDFLCSPTQQKDCFPHAFDVLYRFALLSFDRKFVSLLCPFSALCVRITV